MDVAGHLQTLGTATNPVTFTSETDFGPGEWGGISINNNGSANLDYTTVRYAGESSGSNLSVYSGTAQIRHSSIINSANDGVYIEGGQVDLGCTTIGNNQGDGIIVSNSGSPNFTMVSSSISGNSNSGLTNENTTLVDARDNWWGDASGPGGIGPGTGDAISGTVSYVPWATATGCFPIARDDEATTLENTPITIDVEANDINVDGGPLTVSTVGPAANGNTSTNGTTIVYTPTLNFSGTDTFTYTITDGSLTDTAAVSVTVMAVEASTLLSPTSGATLVVTNTQTDTITATIQVPAGAVTETATLIYNSVSSSTHSAPAGFNFAGMIFTLDIYQNNQLQANFIFSSPITITLEYDPNALGGLDENTLALYFWDEAAQNWSADGISVVERDTANHRLVVTITHLTEFALVAQASAATSPVYLPIVLKDF